MTAERLSDEQVERAVAVADGCVNEMGGYAFVSRALVQVAADLASAKAELAEVKAAALRAVLDPLCVCLHPKSEHIPKHSEAMGRAVLACTEPTCACGPGCIHEGFVDRADIVQELEAAKAELADIRAKWEALGMVSEEVA